MQGLSEQKVFTTFPGRVRALVVMVLRPSASLACAAFLVTLPGLCKAVTTNEFGKKFLEGHRKREFTRKLDDGLLVDVFRDGDGLDHPTEDSPCEINWEGRIAQDFPNGKKFGSTFDSGESVTLAPNQVMPGWKQAMLQMVEGDKWELYVPAELAYSDEDRPAGVGADDALVFIVEIVKIKGGRKSASHCNVITEEYCKDKEIEYISKLKGLGAPEGPKKIKKELTRLKSMEASGASNMNEEKRSWLAARINLLEKLSKMPHDEF